MHKLREKIGYGLQVLGFGLIMWIIVAAGVKELFGPSVATVVVTSSIVIGAFAGIKIYLIRKYNSDLRRNKKITPEYDPDVLHNLNKADQSH